MQIDNLTTSHFDLAGPYELAPSASNYVIPDSAFNENSTLRSQLESLLRQSKINVDTPPAGFTVSNGKFVETPTASGTGAVEFRDSPAEGTNAAVVSTIAAPGAGKSHYLTAVTVGFGAAPAAAVVVQVESPSGTVIWKRRIGTTAPFIWEQNFIRPLKGADNQAMVVRLPAGGAAIVGYVNQAGYTANT
jgi:hypothetical protein